MAVTVLVELQIKEDKVETLLQGIKETLPDMRAFDGFVAFEVVQNQEKPTNIILIQKWQTRAHHDNYLIQEGLSRTEIGGIEQLGTMLVGAPSVRYFDTQEV